MAAYKIEPACDHKFLFGEAPLWDHRDRKLYFVDGPDLSVCSYDPLTQNVVKKRVCEDVDYIILAMPYQKEKDSSKRFLVPGSGKIMEFDWDSGKSKVVLDINITKNNPKSFSDGKVDAKGILWIGTYEATDLGSLGVVSDYGCIHRVTKSDDMNFKIESMASGYDIPNGLAWNRQNDKLFYCDLVKRAVNVYDYDLIEGTIANGRVFFDFKKYTELENSMPDGMTIDLDGNIYIACWKGGAVIKVDGQTGKLVDKISIPVTNTTSVIFGDDGFTSLYLTTTSVELDKSVKFEHEPHSGKLFRITNPKDNTFKGFEQFFLQY